MIRATAQSVSWSGIVLVLQTNAIGPENGKVQRGNHTEVQNSTAKKPR
jgi:hypothetical protein